MPFKALRQSEIEPLLGDDRRRERASLLEGFVELDAALAQAQWFVGGRRGGKTRTMVGVDVANGPDETVVLVKGADGAWEREP